MKNKIVILEEIYETQMIRMNIRAKAIQFNNDFDKRIQYTLQILKRAIIKRLSKTCIFGDSKFQFCSSGRNDTKLYKLDEHIKPTDTFFRCPIIILNDGGKVTYEGFLSKMYVKSFRSKMVEALAPIGCLWGVLWRGRC